MTEDTETTLPPGSGLPDNSPWWAKWLVAEWRQAWRWLSVQLPLWGGILIEVYAANAEAISQHVPKEWVPHIVAVMFWMSMAGRLVKQKTVVK